MKKIVAILILLSCFGCKTQINITNLKGYRAILDTTKTINDTQRYELLKSQITLYFTKQPKK
jgi:hypothetical protein